MKKKKKWIKWVVILVIVAAVIGWFMMVSRKTQDVAYTFAHVPQPMQRSVSTLTIFKSLSRFIAPVGQFSTHAGFLQLWQDLE